DHDGFLVSRSDDAEHPGRLAALRTVVSHEPVLTPQVARAAREVADHYGGTLADVLRLAVPPRHARAERAVAAAAETAATGPAPVAGPGGEASPAVDGVAAADEAAPDSAWTAYPAGPALIRRLAAGGSPSAAWLA